MIKWQTDVVNVSPTENNRLTAAYFATWDITQLLGITYRLNFTLPRGISRVKNSVGLIGVPDEQNRVQLSLLFNSYTASAGFSPNGFISTEEGSGGYTSQFGAVDRTNPSSIWGSFLVRSQPTQSTPEPSMLLGGVAIALGALWRTRRDRPA